MSKLAGWIYRTVIIVSLIVIGLSNLHGLERCEAIRNVMVEEIANGIDRQNELRNTQKLASKLMVDLTLYLCKLEDAINELKKGNYVSAVYFNEGGDITGN